MVPGREAAAAAARATKSKEAWVKERAILLLATAVTLHVSLEGMRDMRRDSEGTSAAACLVCVSTMMVTSGL